MIIVAKFASTCPCCNAPIEVGTKIEWTRGTKARHVSCAASPAAVSVSSKRPRRNWRPCGYPGCNPNYCDECDGEGYRTTWVR